MQIDVAVNAPEAGTIKEFLVNEEDTVTVGQDLLRLELGGPPEGGASKKAADSESKEPTPSESESKSEPNKVIPEPENKPAPKETKPEPKKESPKSEPKKTDPKSASTYLVICEHVPD